MLHSNVPLEVSFGYRTDCVWRDSWGLLPERDATDNAIYPALFLTYLTGNGGHSKYVGWFQKILLHKCTQPGVGGFQLPGP